MPKHYLTLGIETSCDETSVAVVRDGQEVLANIIASQIEEHRRFGGVVPEIASRQHIDSIVPVVEDALRAANVTFSDISQIAVTAGPGLVGALLVGVSYAKGLAYSLGIPLVGVNHLEGHIYANYLISQAHFPAVCLIVSGGHTDLIYQRGHGQFEIIGQTRDDAAGEAFDKVARALGLPYPGGPEIDRLSAHGDRQAYSLPRPYLGEGSLDFSFSGLKSAVLNLLNQATMRQEIIVKADLAASFQEAVVDVLVDKAIQAALGKGVKHLYLAGGVSANSRLRQRLQQASSEAGLTLHYPPLILCTDNAAMIACAGFFRWQHGSLAGLDLNASPNLPLVNW